MQDLEEKHPLCSPRRKCRNYAYELEPLFENDLLCRLGTGKGYRWLAEQVGVPKGTIAGWNQKRRMDRRRRPSYNPREGMSTKLSREESEQLRQGLLSDPGMSHKEVNAEVLM